MQGEKRVREVRAQSVIIFSGGTLSPLHRCPLLLPPQTPRCLQRTLTWRPRHPWRKKSRKALRRLRPCCISLVRWSFRILHSRSLQAGALEESSDQFDRQESTACWDFSLSINVWIFCPVLSLSIYWFSNWKCADLYCRPQTNPRSLPIHTTHKTIPLIYNTIKAFPKREYKSVVLHTEAKHTSLSCSSSNGACPCRKLFAHLDHWLHLFQVSGKLWAWTQRALLGHLLPFPCVPPPPRR